MSLKAVATFTLKKLNTETGELETIAEGPAKMEEVKADGNDGASTDDGGRGLDS